MIWRKIKSLLTFFNSCKIKTNLNFKKNLYLLFYIGTFQLAPLTVSIKRHILPSSKMAGRGPPHPLPASSPASQSHSRVKKLLAQFGSGGSSTGATPTNQGSGAATPTFQSVNPRKRELDLSELTFPHSKKFRQEVCVYVWGGCVCVCVFVLFDCNYQGFI